MATVVVVGIDVEDFLARSRERSSGTGGAGLVRREMRQEKAEGKGILQGKQRLLQPSAADNDIPNSITE